MTETAYVILFVLQGFTSIVFSIKIDEINRKIEKMKNQIELLKNAGG